LFDNLREDTRRLKDIKHRAFPWYVIESLLFDNGYQAVVLFRLAHWFKKNRLPFFGPLFGRLSHFLTGVDIAPGAEIGPGLFISHGTGIVIGQWARLGSRAMLLQQVTIGATGLSRIQEMPQIGDNVFIGAGARIIGPVKVGDNTVIGVNAIVHRDIPSDSKVICQSGLDIRQIAKADPDKTSKTSEDPA
jgi:serine O-acetyltransferase